MVLLTGVLTGTVDNDAYNGTIAFIGEKLGPDAEIIDSIALDLTLRSLEGNDTIRTTASLFGTGASVIDLFGMRHVDIDTGAGNDTVSVTGNIDWSGTAIIPSATFQGIAGSVINTGVGNDTVFVLSNVDLGLGASGRPITSAFSIGLQNSALDTGANNDRVTVRSFATSSSSAIATALDLSQITTGTGQDTVSIEVNAEAAPFGEGRATGLQRSWISTGDDNDTVSIVVTSTGVSEGGRRTSGIAIGLSDSQIFGGQGQNAISIEIEFNSVARGLSSSSIEGGSDVDIISVSTRPLFSNGSSIGLDAASRISAGDGSDEITITSTSFGGASIQAIGTRDSWVLGESGDDRITLQAAGTSQPSGIKSGPSIITQFTNPDIYGSFNSLVHGGAGNDELNIQAFGTLRDSGSSPIGANKGDIFGVLASTIAGGQGNDSISITSSVTLQGNPIIFAPNSIGAVESVLNGEDGDDNLFVRGVNLDIDDVVVLGGSGNDIIDTGIGSGNIYGNLGQDLIKLDFFDAATMSIELLGSDSLRIVGTQDKRGNSLDWTQTIFDMEQFEVAGNVYSATEVVALLG